MKKQLEQMATELREMMIFQSPPELGALWTDVSEMMKEIGGQQKVLLTRKLREEAKAAERRRQKMRLYMTELSYGGFIFIIGITMTLLMAYISHDRKQRWPELEPEIIKQHQAERKRIRLLELEQMEEEIKRRDEEFKRESE